MYTSKPKIKQSSVNAWRSLCWWLDLSDCLVTSSISQGRPQKKPADHNCWDDDGARREDSAGRAKMLSRGNTGDRLAEVDEVLGCLVVQTFDWLSKVWRPTKHIIGHIGDDFYRSYDQTNSVKALKEASWSFRKGLIPSGPLHHVTIIQTVEQHEAELERDLRLYSTPCWRHSFVRWFIDISISRM